MTDESTALARLAHLNAVLRGIRSVNKLLARERDPDELLRQAAEQLVEARGFLAVAMVRTEGDVVTRSFVAGRAEERAALGRALASDMLPECLLLATRDGEQVTRPHPIRECRGCPVNPGCAAHRDSFAAPIEHERRRFGAVLVVLPEGAASLPDELDLLGELCSDLAMGLRNIELSAALGESEQRFRRALETIPDVILIYDRELRIRYINAATQRLTGRTSAEYIGRRDEEMWPAEVCGIWLPALRRALATGEVQRLEAEIDLPPGRRALELTWLPLLDDRGEVREIVGVAHDATDHHAERALQDQFAHVAASAPGLVCTYRLRPDGTVCMPFSTPAILDVFGITQEEAARDLSSWAARIDPDELARVNDHVAECARTLSRWHEVYRYHHPDKGLRWIEGWSSPIRQPDGSIDWHGFVMDVTERKQAEEAARAGMDRYRSLFDNMLSGCVHGRVIFEDGVATDWEYLAVNSAYERMTGLHGVVGKRAAEVVVGIHEANPEFRRVLGQVVRTGEPARHESYIAPLDRWFSVGVYRPVEGEFVAVLDDVTERRKAEHRLRESEARFRALFEEAGVGVAQIDARDGRFVLINDKYCEIVGRTREEMLADDWPSITHPDDVAADRDNVAGLVAGAITSFSREKRYLRKDGAIVWVALTVSRMWSDGELPNFNVAVVEDITPRKRAEAALLEAQAELRAFTADLERRVAERTAELDRAARAKDEFLASMSHELRTPLNGILGLTEALGEGVYGPFSERQTGALGRIGESGRHLLDLINDILDVAKVEAGKIELELRPVSLPEVCRASLRLVQEPALRKQIALQVNIDPGLPALVADERRLKQVLVNLLTNAVKFTPDGGAVGVDVARSAGEDTLSIAVWDTGVGIAPEDLSRLFRPFVQLDSRLSRQHAGTGLGLALVRRLVLLHGGEVHVESEVGRGSRFTVALPIRPRPEVPSADARAMSRPPTPPRGTAVGRTVLIADDDETNRALLRDLLEHHGYVVREARDGREAVAEALALRPDVVLMDVQMPHLDGLAAMRALRASAATARTPMIALTALAMPGDEARCREAGADEYLAKPIALQRLLKLIERLAARGR